jgi:hypothetical protein
MPKMGLERMVSTGAEVRLAELVERLAADGLTAMVVMIDGALVAPGTPPPAGWREARLRTPAGTITLARRPGGVAVVVFGNADEDLRRAQEQVAAALQGS